MESKEIGQKCVTVYEKTIRGKVVQVGMSHDNLVESLPSARVTPEEKAAIVAHAKKQGITVSKLTRKVFEDYLRRTEGQVG